MKHYTAKHTHTQRLRVASGLLWCQSPLDTDLKFCGHLKQDTMLCLIIRLLHNKGTKSVLHMGGSHGDNSFLELSAINTFFEAETGSFGL